MIDKLRQIRESSENFRKIFGLIASKQKSYPRLDLSGTGASLKISASEIRFLFGKLEAVGLGRLEKDGKYWKFVWHYEILSIGPAIDGECDLKPLYNKYTEDFFNDTINEEFSDNGHKETTTQNNKEVLIDITLKGITTKQLKQINTLLNN